MATQQKIAEPASLVISVEDARRHVLAVDDEDEYLLELIAAAQEQIETATRRTLTTTRLRAVFDRFPHGATDPVCLPAPPLQSVEKCSYVDLDGVDQELDVDSDIIVVTRSTPGTVLPVTSWPATLPGRPVVWEITAGYQTVPPRAKHAARVLVAHWYLMREAVAVGGSPVSVPHSFKALCAGLKWGDYS